MGGKLQLDKVQSQETREHSLTQFWGNQKQFYGTQGQDVSSSNPPAANGQGASIWLTGISGVRPAHDCPSRWQNKI